MQNVCGKCYTLSYSMLHLSDRNSNEAERMLCVVKMPVASVYTWRARYHLFKICILCLVVFEDENPAFGRRLHRTQISPLF